MGSLSHHQTLNKTNGASWYDRRDMYNSHKGEWIYLQVFQAPWLWMMGGCLLQKKLQISMPQLQLMIA